ncbi:MAG: thiosulfate oxidation carrier complex protein SoxZ [Paracoccaceae bacterium]
MADGVKTRIKVPEQVKAGDVFSIKTLITHQMETGQRVNILGLRIPRSIIHRFHCTFNGETVVDMAMQPGIAVNPFFEFDAKIDEPGTFEFTWYDDDGSVYSDAADVSIA